MVKIYIILENMEKNYLTKKFYKSITILICAITGLTLIEQFTPFNYD